MLPFFATKQKYFYHADVVFFWNNTKEKCFHRTDANFLGQYIRKCFQNMLGKSAKVMNFETNKICYFLSRIRCFFSVF